MKIIIEDLGLSIVNLAFNMLLLIGKKKNVIEAIMLLLHSRTK